MIGVPYIFVPQLCLRGQRHAIVGCMYGDLSPKGMGWLFFEFGWRKSETARLEGKNEVLRKYG